MKDFTLSTYRQLLLALKNGGCNFLTFEEWCDGKATVPFVILRHDVDLKAGHSLATARIEAEMGVKATYYFRIVPQSNQPEIIESIVRLGHEIGYHYEDLSLFNGDSPKAIDHFDKQLTHFRQFYSVRTICMHGSPISKFDNRDLWKTYNYHDYGIIGEPYFDFLNAENIKINQILYFTDTARMWDGDKYNVRDKINQQLTVNSEQVSSQQLTNSATHQDVHSTFDFINWINSNPSVNCMMITTHPQRWTDNKIEWFHEFIMQFVKNKLKQLLVRIR